MPSTDDRYLPPPPNSLTDVHEQIRDIWEVLHTLEGRTGPISLRDDVSVLGDLSTTGAVTAGSTVELTGEMTFNERPRDSDLSLSPPEATDSNSVIYWDTTAERLRVSENERDFQDLVMYEACRVTKAALQTITNDTPTVITFDAERFDTAGMHSTVVNNSRITFPTNGVYLIGASIGWEASAVEFNPQLRIKRAGAVYIAIQGDRSTNSAFTGNFQAITTAWQATAGDYVEVEVYQNSGGDLDVGKNAQWTPEFWAVRLI